MWTITRQSQWSTGNQVVEISAGSLDYANADALCKKYKGEFETFADPREAVSAAIRIAEQWQKDNPKEKILIDHGSTGGFTMPFDGIRLTKKTKAELKKWADDLYEKMEKCDHCGDVLPEKGKRWGNCDYGEYNCCSEYCADKYWAEQLADLHEELEGKIN